MAPKAKDVYEAAAARLEWLWQQPPPVGIGPELAESASELIAEGNVAQRYALVTQLLLKLVLPEADARALKGFPDAPSTVSSRSLAKQVVCPFDSSHGAPLGGSRDPYVSQPLRRDRLDPSVATGPDYGLWESLLDVLDEVEDDPSLAEPVLLVALEAMRERVHDLSSLISAVLESQAAGMTSERGELVEKVAPQVLAPSVPPGLSVEGSGGAGTPAEVPWFRVYSPAFSPSAQEGWYVAYLFDAEGECAFLCLIQGITVASAAAVVEGTAAVRERFADRGDFEASIDLRSHQQGGRPHQYEQATALAKRYARGSLPSAEQLGAGLDEMLELLEELYESEVEDTVEDSMQALTTEAVLAEAEKDGLELGLSLVHAAVAAIRAGQHVLFTGPPGTGKTSLAACLARAAAAAKLSRGFELVTATADWTSAETIGGYWPQPDGQALKFVPGPVLQAIDRQAWLVIDELNRADIDKAFGPMFTVLSGHSARLAVHEEVGGEQLPVEILPPGREAAGDTASHTVGKQWRLIATLNTRDRDLLFGMSYALLRRFAVIEVPVPEKDEYEEILKARAATGDEVLDQRLAALSSLPCRQLGPAILIDCGAYLRERVALEESPDHAQLLAEALAAFVLPQLDDLTRPQQAEVMRFLRSEVLLGWPLAKVAALLASTFQSSAQELVDLAGADAEDEQPE